MGSLFVTATGTDVGKTFIAARIIRALRRRGRAATALKPVMSGFEMAQAAESDAGRLLSAMGRRPTATEIERLSPWRFAAPLSPDMAAAREGRTIAFGALVDLSRRAIADAGGAALLIEGVGGVMVPLDDRHTVLDWIAAAGAPALLVAGSYLGTISHTLTALDALGRRSVAIAAVAISETPESTVGLDETVAEIARFAAPAPVIGVPRLARPLDAHPSIERLADLL